MVEKQQLSKYPALNNFEKQAGMFLFPSPCCLSP